MVFSDLHVHRRTLDVSLAVLRRARRRSARRCGCAPPSAAPPPPAGAHPHLAGAAPQVQEVALQQDAGVLFLGDFWHARGALPVEPLNAVLEARAGPSGF